MARLAPPAVLEPGVDTAAGVRQSPLVASLELGLGRLLQLVLVVRQALVGDAENEVRGEFRRFQHFF